ncbi:bifunctional 4-hydroxy-2-oxoglutarate aldolase/2-dehydro-3-deoxy-phosphogluconate aldolase [Pedobacter sp. ASV12]|uniref:bifunctional 4-hydroxy-2-oxoglutarate aldolase/2-dehydro-3-deoxy-phosphogluconate aldolase n=1 Tax=Pedobacter sp. ASV12 TaxID=2795120 RepID=UPI0018EB1FAD|nr:bifunctional 4-hydroxy-2-oxoglutarate aldolase/2-dehydro-3-deoxy-phosphogluconate aldolase [Pedobacter sp. ASV12]
MKNKETAIQAIKTQGLLPLFYDQDAQLSLDIIRTLYRAGVRVFEYTNRGDAALENFKFIKQTLQTEMQDLFLGIGTIKNVEEAKAFLAIDADFVVCPVVDLEVGRLVHEASKLWIPGCMSPTEINLAHQNQAGIIKLFPANILGPSYLSSIKELFQGQLFVPTGGVEIEESNIDSWFKAGVCAVGMGSKLISKQILENKDYDTLFSLTTKTLAIVNKVKP